MFASGKNSNLFKHQQFKRIVDMTDHCRYGLGQTNKNLVQSRIVTTTFYALSCKFLLSNLVGWHKRLATNALSSCRLQAYYAFVLYPSAIQSLCFLLTIITNAYNADAHIINILKKNYIVADALDIVQLHFTVS